MKEDKIIMFLRTEQKRIQNALKKEGINFSYVRKNNLDVFAFGIWISLKCEICGKDYSTPFNIRDNGRCSQCGKRVYSFKRSRRR